MPGKGVTQWDTQASPAEQLLDCGIGVGEPMVSTHQHAHENRRLIPRIQQAIPHGDVDADRRIRPVSPAPDDRHAAQATTPSSPGTQGHAMSLHDDRQEALHLVAVGSRS